MESMEKTLKERLPHNAIKEIAKVVGVSSPVVSRVVNRTVEFKRADGSVVRICSEELEKRILQVAENYAEKHEEFLGSLLSVG